MLSLLSKAGGPPPKSCHPVLSNTLSFVSQPSMNIHKTGRPACSGKQGDPRPVPAHLPQGLQEGLCSPGPRPLRVSPKALLRPHKRERKGQLARSASPESASLLLWAATGEHTLLPPGKASQWDRLVTAGRASGRLPNSTAAQMQQPSAHRVTHCHTWHSATHGASPGPGNDGPQARIHTPAPSAWPPPGHNSYGAGARGQTQNNQTAAS